MPKNIAKVFDMHIIIPMSGVGQRFIDAGYLVPKPLIVIDGKPIIQHVVELFPGENKFTFICNQTHLETTEMRGVLESIVANPNIVSIANHKKGPVYAVTQILDSIDDNEEVIVNYCDFGSYWNYQDFLEHTRYRKADGAIAAYKGFHPHMLGSTNYAFMRDSEQWMLEIQEKQPFTNNRMNEYASNGTYYFRTGLLVKKYFPLLIANDIHLNSEFYVSLIYNLLVQDGLSVSIYEIEHMLQWGTPEDVEEYTNWSKYFTSLIKPEESWSIEKNSSTLIPLAGHGSRFKKEGYEDPKPLLDVSGSPMIIQASNQLPASEYNHYVCLAEHVEKYNVDEAIKSYQKEASITVINQVTEGQAISCELGMSKVDDNQPLIVAACDNGIRWDHKAYQSLIENETIDAIVWTFKGHPSARENPEMYGWVKIQDVDTYTRATGISVKQVISSQPENDHAIVGTFYFRKSSLFRQALKQLVEQNLRINNEFYVDSLMGILIDLGYNVAVFEVDAYIGWGTPNDYKTFLYWQSYFHKCPEHPYQLGKDVTANKNNLKMLEQSFYSFAQEYRQ